MVGTIRTPLYLPVSETAMSMLKPSRLQPHGPAGEEREVDETCSHVGVNAGEPWTLKEGGGRRGTLRGGILCSRCGVWWPGHELAKPERRGNLDPDYRRTDRDDVERHVREPLPPRPSRTTASWSNLK